MDRTPQRSFRKKMVCIGFDAQHQDFGSLTGAVEDARRWYSFASERLDFEVRLVTHDDLPRPGFPRGLNLLQLLDEEVSDLAPGDLFGLFLATHGKEIQFKGDKRERLFTLPGTTNAVINDYINDPGNGRFGTGGLFVTLNQLETITSRPGVRRFFVLDACRSVVDLSLPTADRKGEREAFSGETIDRAMVLSISRKRRAERSPLTTVNSCSNGQVAKELKQERGGFFTLSAIEVLRAKHKAHQPLRFDEPFIADVQAEMRDKAQRLQAELIDQRPALIGDEVELWSLGHHQRAQLERLLPTFESQLRAGTLEEPVGACARDTLAQIRALDIPPGEKESLHQALAIAVEEDRQRRHQALDEALLTAARERNTLDEWNAVLYRAQLQPSRQEAQEALARLRGKPEDEEAARSRLEDLKGEEVTDQPDMGPEREALIAREPTSAGSAANVEEAAEVERSPEAIRSVGTTGVAKSAEVECRNGAGSTVMAKLIREGHDEPFFNFYCSFILQCGLLLVIAFDNFESPALITLVVAGILGAFFVYFASREIDNGVKRSLALAFFAFFPGVSGIVSLLLFLQRNRFLRNIDPYKVPAGTDIRDAGWTPRMVVIPAGRFMMGSPEDEHGRKSREGPQREVHIRQPFGMARTAVTFEEYDHYAKEAKVPLPGDQGWGRGKRPVINVSWEDAQGYIAWLNAKLGLSPEQGYRLPTEAEWEYAARAGSTTPFWWGRSIMTNQANYDGSFDYAGGEKGRFRKRTVVADSFAPNPWGLYNVHGNVFEWVQDEYTSSPVTDQASKEVGATSPVAWPFPSDPAPAPWSVPRRVVRGGSWFDDPVNLRSAYRNGDAPDLRGDNLGFRLARTI